KFYTRQFPTRSRLTDPLLSKFHDLLNQSFDADTSRKTGIPTVQSFAEEMGMSPSYLSDLIKKITGETAGRYIKN
ncbi:MAG: AraC family transcriptional regulator, partial [Muribaculaceae bacterium]|nr:AraC family transcriptional regulator [Muribaculaceae bacterium]